MAGTNNKRIEESATTALKTALLRCRYIDSYIDSNDKTPSWDGTIFVYKNHKQKKSDLLGRVPIQVKGTGNRIISEQASFACNVVDLNNYYNDGGCVFFLISVDPASGWYKIFYVSLLTFDLAGILKSAGNQGSYTIKLNTFPENDENEMANIFMNFVQNKPKQMSFIGKDTLSIEALEKSGTKIESLFFETTGVGINKDKIESFITTHDFYLYAKTNGLDINIPVDRVSNAIVSRIINGSVSINGNEHYSSYSVIYKKGKPSFQIGEGLLFIPPDKDNNATVKFKPAGTLSALIKDTTFFIGIINNKEMSLNGVRIQLKNLSIDDIESYQSRLAYFKDVKKMLDMLGVTEELQCGNLSTTDEINLRNFVRAVLYGKKMGFPKMDTPVIYGPFKISNLIIQIWATRQDDGYYILDSFFNNHPIVMFASEDMENKYPIPASHYLLMQQDAFEHSSNMDYEKIYDGLTNIEYSPQMTEHAVLLLLEMLKGYDAQAEKDATLLELVKKVCKWIEDTDPCAEPDIVLLNKLQIAKRQRKLTLDELLLLKELIKPNKPADIRCGAYLLLDDSTNAQICYEEMDEDLKTVFITYPICSFGHFV